MTHWKTNLVVFLLFVLAAATMFIPQVGFVFVVIQGVGIIGVIVAGLIVLKLRGKKQPPHQ